MVLKFPAIGALLVTCGAGVSSPILALLTMNFPAVVEVGWFCPGLKLSSDENAAWKLNNEWKQKQIRKPVMEVTEILIALNSYLHWCKNVLVATDFFNKKEYNIL